MKPWICEDHGRYEVTYVVQSDQFPDARMTICFKFSGDETVEFF